MKRYLDDATDFEIAGAVAGHVFSHGALLAYGPAYYERSRMWKNKGSDTAANRRTLVSPDRLAVNINNIGYEKVVEQEFDLDVAACWDTVIDTDYSIAANRVGKDFYIYACQPAIGSVPLFLLSSATTFPTGYNANSSRKIGQFHCECVSVGAINSHALTGYLAGDILPRSIQDLIHRPRVGFINGVTWGGPTDFDAINYVPVWKAIYLSSGVGVNAASVFNAAVTVSRDWNDFVDDFGCKGCRMLDDYEFQLLCNGIEERVNIKGSSNVPNTGGHISTTDRRMISNIGSEDDSGVFWQWLSTHCWQFTSPVSHTHDVVVSGDPQTATSGVQSVAITPPWITQVLPGGKGSVYIQGAFGDVKLLGGGSWLSSTACGSRGRNANNHRWCASTHIGSRFVAD
jgi:hypothetical protein